MLLETMKEQLTTALKNGEKETALTLRSLIATLHNEKIRKGDVLTDEDIFKVLKTETKKRVEAHEAFMSAGREESAANEKREKELINTFLPQQLSDEVLGNIIDEVITTAQDPKNFGLLMKSVMEKAGSKADGSTVSRLLKEKLE
jgi:uncharacterized protein